MKDKIVATIKVPFVKLGSAVYDRGNKLSNTRIGVESSVVILLIIVLAIL
jgi:hypothetical protein